MLGVTVNALAVIAGSAIGLLVGKKFKEEWSSAIMKALGFCVIFIGIQSAFDGKNILYTIVSLVIGGIIGFALDLDGLVNKGADKVEKLVSKGDTPQNGSIAVGFVTGSLMFCTGAMTIVGSIQSGMTGDNTMLFTKSALDFVSSIIFATTLGIGVMLSAGFVFVFQGLVWLLSIVAAPLLSEACIAEVTCVGSILLMIVGSNMIGLTKIKVMNFMPSIFLPILLVKIVELAGTLIHF